MDMMEQPRLEGQVKPESQGERELPKEDQDNLENFLSRVEKFRRLKRGDVLEGRVVQIAPAEILVDIGFKSEGVIPAHEISETRGGEILSVGDVVLVYVVQPEGPDERVILSLSRAQAEKDWRLAQKQSEDGEILELEVIGYNKGGLIVRYGEIRGFVPASQVFELRGPAAGRDLASAAAQPDPRMIKMVGKKLQLKIIEVDRSKNRLILSETAAAREWRDGRKERLLATLQEGEVRRGRVSSLANFGAFVDLGGADGLVHLSELSWKPITHPGEVVQVGDEVTVQVLTIDREKKRIALSVKRLQPEPWQQVLEHYKVDQFVEVTITKLATFGAFARLEAEGIEGLIHISELSDTPVSHPKAVVKTGDRVTARIIRIDPEHRRLGLSLKQGGSIHSSENAPSPDTGAALSDDPGVKAAEGDPPS